MEKYELPDHVYEQAPRIDSTAFVANGAIVVGDVRLNAQSSVWYNAVLRGDINYIEIGKRSNIQDGCVLHLENDRPCIVGDDVTVGHGAILHGCTIENKCLIGMGAIILNGAVIKEGSIIGAGAVVKENTIVEPKSLMVGTPARKVKVCDDYVLDHHKKWAEKYVKLAQIHRSKEN